ncbi:MAG: tRNA (adenosine(37)-N6)-threonylcarbamoyltransferase complex dimerization subunit type 1 TsaB [Thermovirgaceae bacterium]
MTLVLGLDCSTGWTSMGLVETRRAVGELTLDLGRRQSARLPALFQNLLTESARDIRNVDIFAITTGPGYFTGIRVGLSYMTGLAYALGKPVVGVSTLFAMAYPFLFDSLTVVPVLRARSDSVFAAIFRRSNGLVEKVLDSTFLSPADLLSTLGEKNLKTTVFVGESIRAFPVLSQSVVKALSWEERPISGLTVAMIGCSRKKEAVSPLVLGARYFRGPDIGNSDRMTPRLPGSCKQ